jgi:hypothetical protein
MSSKQGPRLAGMRTPASNAGRRNNPVFVWHPRAEAAA